MISIYIEDTTPQQNFVKVDVLFETLRITDRRNGIGSAYFELNKQPENFYLLNNRGDRARVAIFFHDEKDTIDPMTTEPLFFGFIESMVEREGDGLFFGINCVSYIDILNAFTAINYQAVNIEDGGALLRQLIIDTQLVDSPDDINEKVLPDDYVRTYIEGAVFRIDLFRVRNTSIMSIVDRVVRRGVQIPYSYSMRGTLSEPTLQITTTGSAGDDITGVFNFVSGTMRIHTRFSDNIDRMVIEGGAYRISSTNTIASNVSRITEKASDNSDLIAETVDSLAQKTLGTRIDGYNKLKGRIGVSNPLSTDPRGLVDDEFGSVRGLTRIGLFHVDVSDTGTDGVRIKGYEFSGSPALIGVSTINEDGIDTYTPNGDPQNFAIYNYDRAGGRAETFASFDVFDPETGSTPKFITDLLIDARERIQEKNLQDSTGRVSVVSNSYRMPRVDDRFDRNENTYIATAVSHRFESDEKAITDMQFSIKQRESIRRIYSRDFIFDSGALAQAPMVARNFGVKL